MIDKRRPPHCSRQDCDKPAFFLPGAENSYCREHSGFTPSAGRCYRDGCANLPTAMTELPGLYNDTVPLCAQHRQELLDMHSGASHTYRIAKLGNVGPAGVSIIAGDRQDLADVLHKIGDHGVAAAVEELNESLSQTIGSRWVVDHERSSPPTHDSTRDAVATVLVVVESPYAGDVATNALYLAACLHDCVQRGESPYASHRILTMDGVLDDTNAEEREKGIALGFAWRTAADKTVFYTDLGWSHGMLQAKMAADRLRADDLEFDREQGDGEAECCHEIEERQLGADWMQKQLARTKLADPSLQQLQGAYAAAYAQIKGLLVELRRCADVECAVADARRAARDAEDLVNRLRRQLSRASPKAKPAAKHAKAVQLKAKSKTPAKRRPAAAPVRFPWDGPDSGTNPKKRGAR